MEFNNLSLQRNKKPVKLGNVSLLQPTLAEIDDIGWDIYQKYLYIIISNSKDIADILWFEYKIWYEDIKDEWDFFVQKCVSGTKEVKIRTIDGRTVVGIGILDDFRDAINFFLHTNGEFVVMDKKQGDKQEIYLCNVTPVDNEDNIYFLDINNFKLTCAFYHILVEYLEKINWIVRDYTFIHGGTKRAKKYILKHDYEERKKKPKESNITIDSIVSSIIAKSCPYNDIWDYPIYMIYDLYYRNVKIDDWKNTMDALHNGCIDVKKTPIKWEEINWSNVIKQ